LPVVEIARRAGFASAQYVCNVFTATYGASPSSWRKLL
ncbi:MAG: AraC family transcriptional regulator, partial [Lentisphaeria bacterium]|nr:AraC family transcriptional regulator [Lentisphaeria bacterium]